MGLRAKLVSVYAKLTVWCLPAWKMVSHSHICEKDLSSQHSPNRCCSRLPFAFHTCSKINFASLMGSPHGSLTTRAPKDITNLSALGGHTFTITWGLQRGLGWTQVSRGQCVKTLHQCMQNFGHWSRKVLRHWKSKRIASTAVQPFSFLPWTCLHCF